jgi:hypothetical protein
MLPIYMGLFSIGVVCVRITMAPPDMPAEPTPAIARPNMNAVEFGAAPQMAEPTSKRTTAIEKMIFGEWKV